MMVRFKFIGYLILMKQLQYFPYTYFQRDEKHRPGIYTSHSLMGHQKALNAKAYSLRFEL